jgi:UDP:flavonoid glycosyltransferase YjiC (YdhE family)
VNPNRPLRVILATVGSRGDVQPMLAVAQALVARGHIPVIAAPPNFGLWIRGLGFEFAELGVDIQALLAGNSSLMTGNPLKMLKEIVRYFTEQLTLQVQQLRTICEGADVMLSAGLAIFVAPSVRERLQLPGFGVLYTTCLLPSNQHPPATIPWQGLPKWLNDLLWRLDKPFGNWLMRGTLNRMRKLLQLEPVPDIWEHLIGTQPPVLAVDEVLLPPDHRWQGRFPYANFLYFDDPSTLDPEIDAWLADGEPPVFVGFGSMSGAGTARIGNLVIEAVKATGLRCIVGAGWAGLGEGALPPDWRVIRDAPHALLFPRTAVVVHHGGSGTTAQALRCGVPQVILPLILDQFHHAHRMYVAGLAPRPVPMEKITAIELTRAIKEALVLPSNTLRITAARLQSSNGCEQVAQRLEELFPR